MVASVGAFGSDYIINKNAHLTGGKICTRISSDVITGKPTESPETWDVENAVYGRCVRSRIENTIETGPTGQRACILFQIV